MMSFQKFLIFYFLILGQKPLLASQIVVANPTPGQCVANLWSKKYLEPYKLGTEVIFSCEFDCRTMTGASHKVTAIQRIYADGGYSEAVGMVCHGVVMEAAVMAGTTVYMPKSVQAFWASTSELKEIRAWAKSNGVQIPPAELTLLKKDFREKILKIAMEYYKVGEGFPAFREASLILLEIYSETPRGLEYLEQMRRDRASGNRSAGDASPLQLARIQVEVHGSFYFQ